MSTVEITDIYVKLIKQKQIHIDMKYFIQLSYTLKKWWGLKWMNP